MTGCRLGQAAGPVTQHTMKDQTSMPSSKAFAHGTNPCGLELRSPARSFHFGFGIFSFCAGGYCTKQIAAVAGLRRAANRRQIGLGMDARCS